jgi:hypothetical protein
VVPRMRKHACVLLSFAALPRATVIITPPRRRTRVAQGPPPHPRHVLNQRAARRAADEVLFSTVVVNSAGVTRHSFQKSVCLGSALTWLLHLACWHRLGIQRDSSLYFFRQRDLLSFKASAELRRSSLLRLCAFFSECMQREMIADTFYEACSPCPHLTSQLLSTWTLASWRLP